MMKKLPLALSLAVIVVAVACGGGEVSTTNAPNVPTAVDKSTVASPTLSEKTPTVQSTVTASTTPLDEADPVEVLALSEAEQRYNRGVKFHRQGRLEEAIAEYDEAIRLDPQLALAYGSRAGAYLDLDQPEKAIKDANDAIRLDPQLALVVRQRCIDG